MNYLYIVMDDMRYDEMYYMPNVVRLLVGEGTNFTWCHAHTPLCSPARAGMFTGQLSGNGRPVGNPNFNYVTTNLHQPNTNTSGGALNAYDNSAFAAVSAGAHRVGMVGKFFTENIGNTARAGFDYWRALGSAGSAYLMYDAFQYSVQAANAPGPTIVTNYTEYQDWRLTRSAVEFMTGLEPWVLWFCPTQPHWPWQDPPNHTTEWSHRNWPLVIESNLADKPSWIQALTPIDPDAELETQIEQRVRLRELISIDEAIGAMVEMIDATGQGDNTTIVFTSDNGNMEGEHNISGGTGNRTGVKNVPYEPSMHVPLVVRGPNFPHNVCTVPTYQQDATATMLALCGATSLLPGQVGINLATIAANPTNSTYLNRKLLGFRNSAGAANPPGMPTADIIVTGPGATTPGLPVGHKLIRWQGESGTDQYEMYNLIADPNELVNLAFTNVTDRNTLNTALGVSGVSGLLA